MKALLINSGKRTIECVEISNYKEIYPLLGPQCGLFQCPVSFDNNDTLYVDEEGLFHDYEGGYIMEGWSYPLVGNGVILGTDPRIGTSKDAITTAEELLSMITWVSNEKLDGHIEDTVKNQYIYSTTKL